jgi:hypothetical protein
VPSKNPLELDHGQAQEREDFHGKCCLAEQQRGGKSQAPDIKTLSARSRVPKPEPGAAAVPVVSEKSNLAH